MLGLAFGGAGLLELVLEGYPSAGELGLAFGSAGLLEVDVAETRLRDAAESAPEADHAAVSVERRQTAEEAFGVAEILETRDFSARAIPGWRILLVSRIAHPLSCTCSSEC